MTAVILTASNATGSDTNTLVITIPDPDNQLPLITGGPTAVPETVAGLRAAVQPVSLLDRLPTIKPKIKKANATTPSRKPCV